MDTVPNPSVMNAYMVSNSPHYSIYDQEKPDRYHTHYAIKTPSSKVASDPPSEDMYSLDEKFEASSLKNMFTSEVISSLHSQSSDYPWCEQTYVNPIVSVSSENSLESTPTLTELNMGMESDLSMVSDLLNLDSNAPTPSPIDFLCNSMGSTRANTPYNTTCSPKTLTNLTTVKSESPRISLKENRQNQKCLNQKPTDSSGENYIRNYPHNYLNNFPPRASQPPIIGVVSPVKQEIMPPIANLPHISKDSLKSQHPNNHQQQQPSSPCLQNLLKPTPVYGHHQRPATGSPPIEGGHKTTELPAQIVPPSPSSALHTVSSPSALQSPSSVLSAHSAHSAHSVSSPPAGLKRSASGSLKAEPASPASTSSSTPATGRPKPRREESIEDKWKDIQNFISEPDEPVYKRRKRHDSGGSGHMSEEHDDAYADDSDDDYSDIDDDIARIKPSEYGESLVSTGKKQNQYFWQYNVQSKGPKGTRLKLAIDSPSDPHVLNDFEDPVFDECNTSVAGIRHGGKARKGDGNEITPNPKKLFMIGHQLLRLNHQINACALGPDVPSARREEGKKEKNKLASRACRLKKKAQHEANKIKLYGLEQEHGQLNELLKTMYPLLKAKAQALMNQMAASQPGPPLEPTLDHSCHRLLKTEVAGKTVDYVNNVILSVESGNNSGGLDIRRKQKN